MTKVIPVLKSVILKIIEVSMMSIVSCSYLTIDVIESWFLDDNHAIDKCD